MASIMSTPSSRISSLARDAAVSELDSTSFTMISTAYDLSPSMIPSASEVLMPARMNSLASPKPASGPVSGAVKPILTVPSPPPPPNWAALAPPAGGVVPADVSPVVPGGAVAPVPAGDVSPARSVSPGVVSPPPASSSSPPHAARNAAAAAAARRRRTGGAGCRSAVSATARWIRSSVPPLGSSVRSTCNGESRCGQYLRCQSSRSAICSSASASMPRASLGSSPISRSAVRRRCCS